MSAQHYVQYCLRESMIICTGINWSLVTRILSKSGVYKFKKKTRNHVQNLGARRTIFNNTHVMKENFWITVLKIWSVPIKKFFTKATWYHAFVHFCSKRCSINMSCYTTASLLQYLVHVWYIKKNDIWDSHNAGNDDGGFLGCNTMWTCTQISEFQRNILPWRWKRYSFWNICIYQQVYKA